jgi:hypothetical protein
VTAPKALLADVASRAHADALLWVSRQYRIRAVRGFAGDKYARWNGEVFSFVKVFHRDGALALSVQWLSESDAVKGSEITAEQTSKLLNQATDRAITRTADVLAQATAVGTMPADLHDDSWSEAKQSVSHEVSELGVFVRGTLLILIVVIGTGLFFSKAYVVATRSAACALLLLVLYLLIGRGWWKDTTMTIIDFVRDVIFG